MSDYRGDIEEIERTGKGIEVHWKIPEFFSCLEDYFYGSPVFKFLHVRWTLRIDPSRYDNKDHVALHLRMDDVALSYNMLCTFGIKQADNSIVDTGSFKHIFCDEKFELIAEPFFTRSELLQSKSKLVPKGNLTITCKLKHLTSPVKLIEPNILSENFKHFYTQEEIFDTTMYVKDKKFMAHRVILTARSPVFAAMFRHDTVENQTGIITISDCDPDSFHEFLKYLYCGELENVSFGSALHLYKTADKYYVQELKMFCVEYMEYNLMAENVCDVIALAEEFDERNLLAVAQDFFNSNLREIFVTDEWKTLFRSNFDLANKILVGMASNVTVVKINAKWKTQK